MRKGFTLIELLVVIAIIGVLSSVVLVSMRDIRARARDARRVEDLNQLKLALELYYAKYEEYPGNTDSGDADCGFFDDSIWVWDAGNTVNGPNDTFIKPLEDAGLIKTPRESTDIKDQWGSQCTYRYVLQTMAACECPKKYAILYTALETDATPPAKTDERPDCMKVDCAYKIGAAGYDYAIFLPY